MRAVIYLALNSNNGEKIGIKKISGELKIPTPFLGKILQVLAKNKILLSTKGPHGGFSLGKPANKITLMNIVDIIDGNDNFNACLIGLGNCTIEEASCSVHEKYTPIRDQLKQLFVNQTINDLANKIKLNQKKMVI